MDEWARLENEYYRKVIVSSNLTSSAGFVNSASLRTILCGVNILSPPQDLSIDKSNVLTPVLLIL